ncbi:MAG: hypothetical protein EU531_00955 [Promethearchaeota archaeon]|nr:MAG: hypothetical protein EU531_00955 [Candidatus Lokiarchaeota archaeon]
MFNPEDFREYSTLFPFVEKINRYLKKGKSDKVSQIVGHLKSLLQEKGFAIPITYIFSILAEKEISFIQEDLVNEVTLFLESDDTKLRLNSIIIVGFYLLMNSSLIDSYLPQFIEMLKQDSNEIVENVYYFLHKFAELNPTFSCKHKRALLERLKTEKIEKNQLALMQFIEPCSNFDFDELYEFKDIALMLVSQYQDKSNNMIISSLISKLSQLFPIFQEMNLDTVEVEELKRNISNLFIMKKYDFTKIAKEQEISLKDYLHYKSESPLIDLKSTFYIRNRDETQTYYYEIEKAKLISFFKGAEKISGDAIKKIFSQIIEDDSELELFMKMLIKLKIVKGYFSNLHYFYPYAYLREDIVVDLQEKGIVNCDKYNYVPPEFLRGIIDEVSTNTKQSFLLGKKGKLYYSQKKINQTVNQEAAKSNAIDLIAYIKRLRKEDFTKLIKNLPKEYLSKYHEGTQYLTNLGLINVRKEIENSKILGYFSISDISTKLKIRKSILFSVLEENIDLRSGVFDKDRNIFYYSKFLNEKIKHINQIKSEQEKADLVNQLANELNIKKNVVFFKLEENLKSIGEEIKSQSEININEYIDKTGMDYEDFLKFIRTLDIDYFKKNDIIIIDAARINEAKTEIKTKLIDKAKNEDFIEFSDLDLTQNIFEDLLHGLQEEQKIIGIFYNDGEKIRFYTKKGIENLMLENQQFFSFQDFFSEKTLSESELKLLTSILNDLMETKRLNGTFDEESLIFSSSEVIFAQNYNTILSEFENLIMDYTKYFESEFGKIKRILIKKDETILPHEIKVIQEIIKEVNYNYVHWRSGIEAYVRNANSNLLKKQGLTLKKYNAMKISPDGKRDVKLFEEDGEVVALLDKFKEWVKLFNSIELKYGNVIFYQKRLSRDPDNTEDREKLKDLLIQLKMIES